ncbi:extracellular solute-binding protein [Ruania halotolerans]|uniref:extracellular solute-binding protein n=1 Tax=Ruania halotolerans TaxID=2897773 RepID=UPI001E2DA177|nr:extracellular solute-binding protein [Ruania halotolerans]UFU05275.1 extracellular solute-binding protein [Ruania halotolerans]
MKSRRRGLLAATTVTLATTLALAACAPGTGTGDETASPGATDAEVSTDLAALGEVTLTVWDQETRGGQDEQMAQLNAAFEEAYPNISINRNSQSFDDLETTLRGALTGNDAPDVVQANNSRGTMGAFVSAGLLRDLEPYAEAYGWADRFSEDVLAVSRYSPDGVTFGSGSLYGLPQVGEVVGVFYSRSALEPIATEDELRSADWETFTGMLADAADAGLTPVQLGNIEGWPAGHVFGPIQAQHVPAEDIRALATGNEGASWTSEGNMAAAAELIEWSEAGYFNEGPNGTDYDAAWSAFAEGDGVFLIGGSWLAADLEAAMGDDVGFVVPTTADGTAATTGGTGLPFAVTEQSPNADAAAGYIDFITSDEAMEVLAETGNMPVNRTAELAPESGVNADIYAAFGAVSEEGELLPYLDWATPTMGDTLGATLQDLIGGQADPEQAMSTLEEDYSAFVSEG